MSQLLQRFAFSQLPLNSIHSCDVDLLARPHCVRRVP